ncbi:uncharacterized protein LOC142582225 [Dermacentor variabilis]|uniref:uncharacterized protein LOC142582225 n=1 Tax=Dermacentor variabilis TaxID=34621 RepID=UPI003F5B771B
MVSELQLWPERAPGDPLFFEMPSVSECCQPVLLTPLWSRCSRCRSPAGAHHRTDRRSSARYHLGCPTRNFKLPGTVPWPCPCCLSLSHASPSYASTSAACDERDQPCHQGAACVSNIWQITYKRPTPLRANLWARWLCHDTVH